MKAIAVKCFVFVDSGEIKSAVIGQPVEVKDKAVFADLIRAGFIAEDTKPKNEEPESKKAESKPKNEEPETKKAESKPKKAAK